MKHAKFLLYSLAALAMVLSLSNAQAASAFVTQEETLAASTPPLLSNIQAIDAGSEHTCALTTAGGVKCWGYNNYGQIGDNTTFDRYAPQNVFGMSSGLLAITTGWMHTCTLTSSGGAKCWGTNHYGQLGDNTSIDRHSPVDVIGLSSGITAISAGGGHTCALTSSGGIKCWGNNFSGQLGNGSVPSKIPTPVDVTGLTSDVVAIAAGTGHTCALTTSGGVKCWGSNVSGQLGDGTTIMRNTPVDVIGLADGVSAISTGQEHSCALMESGKVKCWGDNRFGQVGDGTQTNRLTPTDVTGLSDITTIQLGEWHSCAITSGGGGTCWGWNKYGRLGDGTTITRLTPVDVSGLTSGVAAISVGGEHTCAQTATNEVRCWGNNQFGQLGNGAFIRRLTAVNVLALEESRFNSVGLYDGTIRESEENSNIGGEVIKKLVIQVGDYYWDRQVVSILAFNTSPLADNIVIHSAMIRLNYQSKLGNPEIGLGKLIADIRKPFFGTSASLLREDFQSPPTKPFICTFKEDSCGLIGSAFQHINRNGQTQFRLRYEVDDNDDYDPDYMTFWSGDAQPLLRPQLIIYYYVP